MTTNVAYDDTAKTASLAFTSGVGATPTFSVAAGLIASPARNADVVVPYGAVKEGIQVLIDWLDLVLRVVYRSVPPELPVAAYNNELKVTASDVTLETKVAGVKIQDLKYLRGGTTVESEGRPAISIGWQTFVAAFVRGQVNFVNSVDLLL